MTWIEGPWYNAKSSICTVSGMMTVGINYTLDLTPTTATLTVVNVVVMPAGGNVTIKYPDPGGIVGGIGSALMPTTYYYRAQISCNIGGSTSGTVNLTGGWTYNSSSKTGTYARNNAMYRFVPSPNSQAIPRLYEDDAVPLHAEAVIFGAHSGDTGGFVLDVSKYIEIPAKQHYELKFDANGGSGGPNPITKWYGENLLIPETTPIKAEQSFLGWATSPTGTPKYQPGDIFDLDSFSGTLYAVWGTALIIRYDANGGTGAPETQIDYTGAPYVTLSTQIPVKKGAKFLGWATKSTATTPEYYSGGIYRSQLSTTLYAVWELAYSVSLDTINVVRCLADGTPDGMGEYMSINGRYVLQGNTAFDSQVSIQVLSPSITASTITGKTYNKYASEEKATPTFKWFSGDDSPTKFDPEQMYEARVTVAIYSSGSLLDSVSRIVTLSRAEYIMDFSSTGKGVGIGSVAPPSGLDISWDTTFYNKTDFRGTVAIANKEDWKKELEIEEILENGKVPLDKGGTGVGSASDIRKLIGLGASTGALDIAYGGTGATSASAARTNLGIPSFPLSVSNGGTGSSTAATARSNLGISGKVIVTVQTINLSGGSLAVNGTTTKSSTCTLSGCTDANYAIRALNGCVANNCTGSLSGSTYTISATIRNVSNATMNVSALFVVFGFKSL